MDASICFIGECMLEISGILPSPLSLGYAGDTFNTATYLARLLRNDSTRVEYMTGVGSDRLSLAMIDFLSQCGVGTKHVRTIKDRKPGLYLIETSGNGERIFHYWRNEAAAKFFLDNTTVETLAEELSSFAGIYLSGISIAVLSPVGKEVLFNALLKSKEHDVQIYFDTNYRNLLWPDTQTAQATFNRFLSLANIALITDTDFAQLYELKYDNIPKKVQNLGINEIVLKRGGEPCDIYYGQEHYSIKACKVNNVVDTTAAGDSFNAAYLAARLKGFAPQTAAQWGHRLASEVIQHHGAIIKEKYMPNFSTETKGVQE